MDGKYGLLASGLFLGAVAGGAKPRLPETETQKFSEIISLARPSGGLAFRI